MTFEILTRSPALHKLMAFFRLSFQGRKMELLFGYGVFRGEFKLRFRITGEYLVDERKINASL